MKTELGVSVAVLAALAAHGKDFDRATLNAMLEKLAALPEPKIKNGPMAMCYKMALPVPVEVRHVCPKCETVTRFVSVCMKNDLAFLRDGAVALKGMGLDIALDESPLCRACTPNFALEERFSKVSWVINGKRTPARKTDVELLKTFLSGGLVLTEARREKVPLKRRIDRLRELLGAPKK